ncbi:MAG: hypothetical protein KF891_12220 [Rhizobacter sp.]|nr:hypothetical protein [Rhizobacter sp.]
MPTPTPPTAPPLLSPKVAAFVQSGVSITLAARGERLVPSISKAVGCVVDAGLRQLSVLAFADPAGAVCRDLTDNGQIAACFSRPSTDETVQVKGRDAQAAPATPLEVAAARRCLDLLIDDLEPMGFSREMLEAVFWGNPAQMVAVRFTPDAAFSQTPGPGAGAALKT